MLEALEKLLGKKPTAAKVDAALEKVRDERATLTARQTAIIDQMAMDDTATDALTSEHAGIGLRLAALDKRASMLSQERTAAVIRELATTFEAKLKGISDNVTALKTIRPQTDAAQQQYRALADQEQRLRTQITLAYLDLTDDINAQATAEGIDRAAVASVIQAARAKYPVASEPVARTNQEARTFTSIGFGTPAPEMETQS